jgi:hypothetical protein
MFEPVHEKRNSSVATVSQVTRVVRGSSTSTSLTSTLSSDDASGLGDCEHATDKAAMASNAVPLARVTAASLHWVGCRLLAIMRCSDIRRRAVRAKLAGSLS